MRSIRALVLAGVAVVALSGCDPFGSSGNTPAPGNDATATASASAGPAPITVPGIDPGKLGARGDLCKLIPAEKAREVLGVDVYTHLPTSEPESNLIDTCNYIGTNDQHFVVNLFVRSDGVQTVKSARALMARSNMPVTEYQVAGFDQAFAANREGNVLKGDTLFSANGFVGKQDLNKLVTFAALAGNAVL